MDIGFVHDWLIHLAGAEKVLETFLQIADAPIYTLVKDEKKLKNSPFENRTIYTSNIQKFPFATKLYQNYLPFFPRAIEQFDLSKHDVIISSSHCVAKGVLTSPNQLHLCYCHSPMRYLWDLYHEYLKRHHVKGLKGHLIKRQLHKLRLWDVVSSNRVDYFLTNSSFTQKRIQKVYRRESEVLHPPIDCHAFEFSEKKQDFYVTASRLVPYKRIDAIVKAFSSMPDKKLIVVGSGPQEKELKKMATKNVEFLGHVPFSTLNEVLKNAKAFIFASFEDFGMAPVEAMSAGTPVIAFNQGGIQDSVIENKTGLFFDKQTEEKIVEAVKRFETKEFDPNAILNQALKFDKAEFKKKFKLILETKTKEFFDESDSFSRRSRYSPLAPFNKRKSKAIFEAF